MKSAKIATFLGASVLLVTGLAMASLSRVSDEMRAAASDETQFTWDVTATADVIPPLGRFEPVAYVEEEELLAPVAPEPVAADVFLPDLQPVSSEQVGDIPTERIVRRVCRVTAYTDRGTTAAGTQSGVGQCAAPGDIPFGTIVYIPALDRTFVATDRTHKRFRKSTVDLFMTNNRAAKEFGLNYFEVVFILPE